MCSGPNGSLADQLGMRPMRPSVRLFVSVHVSCVRIAHESNEMNPIKTDYLRSAGPKQTLSFSFAFVAGSLFGLQPNNGRP